MQETYIKTDSGFERINWRYNSYDDQGRLLETLYSNNTQNAEPVELLRETEQHRYLWNHNELSV